MLATYLAKNPLPAAVTLKDLHRSFLDSIAPEDRVAWGRSRFLAELGKNGLSVALVDRVNYVYPAGASAISR